MTRRCFSVVLLAAGMLLPAAVQARRPEAHPRIHHALYELREARGELSSAAHDFGGHRKAALKDINAAIGQLEKALKHTGDKHPFKGDPKAEHYKKYKHHPHIHHAIHEVKEAVHEMKKASHNYGGHRKQAVHDCEAAIKQLHLCLKHAHAKN
jgi:hypothetical protein